MLKKENGFTIVELLIVVVVIAVLATIVIVAYNGISNRADASARLSEMRSLEKQVKNYHTVNGNYPGTSYIDGCPAGSPKDCYYLGVNGKNSTPLTDSTTYSGSTPNGTVSIDTLKSMGIWLPDNSGYYRISYESAVLTFLATTFKDPALIPAENRIAKDTDPVFPISTPFSTYITSQANRDRVIKTSNSLVCADGSAITPTYGTNNWNSSSTNVTNLRAPSGSGIITGNGLYVFMKAFSCGGTQVGLLLGVVDIYGSNRAAFVIEN